MTEQNTLTVEKLKKAKELLDNVEFIDHNQIHLSYHLSEIHQLIPFYNWWFKYETSKPKQNDKLIKAIIRAQDAFKIIRTELETVRIHNQELNELLIAEAMNYRPYDDEPYIPPCKL